MIIRYVLLGLLFLTTAVMADDFEGKLSSYTLAPTPFLSLSQREIECMARNIFYEAGAEPIEGKVAVAMVTINRTRDPNFPRDICGVVKQRVVYSIPKNVTIKQTVKTGWFTPDKEIIEVKTTWIQRAVCQFSWACTSNIKIKVNDPRWVETQEVIEKLLNGGYLDYREKYENAKHFHAVFVHPNWNLKQIAKVGRHIFYE